MKYKAILFDLDGTLLPMEDLSAFKQMIGILMGKKLRGLGLDIDPKAFSEANHKGISAMKENDGSRTNQEAFYEEMYKGLGEQGEIGCRIFHDFYEIDFEPV